jgi:hypothetical protein
MLVAVVCGVQARFDEKPKAIRSSPKIGNLGIASSSLLVSHSVQRK